MKGIYIINSLDGGGAERVFSKLVALKSNKNSKDFVIFLLDSKTESYSLPADIKVVRLEANKNPLKAFFVFINEVKKIKPEYGLSFLTRANIFNTLGAKLLGYKSIISERSNTSGRIKQGPFSFLKVLSVKILYGMSNGIIAVSNGVKECLCSEYGIDAKKVYVLNNPIESLNLEDLLKKEDASSPIISVGRLVETKGFDVLLKAYAKSGVDRNLQILGEGPQKQSLYSLAVDLGIADKVKFLGYQKNIIDYLSQSAFFAMSSRLEGFPNALMEAMSVGKAVIATDCTDGPREIFDYPGVISASEFVITDYGMLLRVDDVEAMALAIKKLDLDFTLRKELQIKSTQRVRHYSPENFIVKYQEIVKSIVSI